MPTDDDLQTAGKEVQGKLWPATLNAPTGQFPVASSATSSTTCSRPRSA